MTVFISNEDMNDIKIIKSLQDLGLLIDGVNEAVKDEIKIKKLWFFWNWIYSSRNIKQNQR